MILLKFLIFEGKSIIKFNKNLKLVYQEFLNISSRAYTDDIILELN